MPDIKISAATAKTKLDNTDMIPVAKSGDTTAYMETGLTLVERTAEIAPNAGAFWTPPAQPAANGLDDFGYSITLNNSTARTAQFMALWEALRAAHSGYITRTSPGKDASGEHDWFYYSFTPAAYEKTIVVICHVHGNEITSDLAMFRFCYHLANDWTSYPELSYLRNKVRMIIVPVCNPWGAAQADRSRQNSNGVDLNRNYDYLWSSGVSDPGSIYYRGSAAFSEAETRYVRDLIGAVNPVAFMDFHNLGSAFGNAFVHVPKNISINEEPARRVMRFMKSDGVDSGIYPMTDATAYNYIAYTHGINSILAEFPDGQFGTAYDATEIAAAVKWYGNLLLQYIHSEVQSVELVSDPKLWGANYKYTDTELTFNGTEYAELTDLRLTFSAPGKGILLVSGEAVVLNSSSAIVYILPAVYQTGGDFVAYNADDYESYANMGADTRTCLPFNCVARIFQTNTKDGENPSTVTIRLYAKVSTGTGKIYRYRCSALWIPASKADALEIYSATGRTGVGITAMQKTYPA